MNLYNVALLFRTAIENAIVNGDITDINMRKFPNGCCGYSSNLLQKYLFENGISTFYMSGIYEKGYGDLESHAWIETEAEIVIDITGDQYKNKTPKFTEQVYVGTRNNGFHNKFKLYNPEPYYEQDETFGIGRKTKEIYDAIMLHMK